MHAPATTHLCIHRVDTSASIIPTSVPVEPGVPCLTRLLRCYSEQKNHSQAARILMLKSDRRRLQTVPSFPSLPPPLLSCFLSSTVNLETFRTHTRSPPRFSTRAQIPSRVPLAKQPPPRFANHPPTSRYTPSNGAPNNTKYPPDGDEARTSTPPAEITTKKTNRQNRPMEARSRTQAIECK